METIGLDDEQLGAFMRLVQFQFMRGQLPDELERIERIAFTAGKHWHVLSPLFPNGKNQWVEKTRKSQMAQYKARVRGGNTRAKQMAEERKRKQETQNGEGDDG